MFRIAVGLPTLLLPALVVGLTACGSGGEGSTPAGTSPASRPTFSAEDRRIAQSLSIGRADLPANASARDQALLCELALETLQDRLLSSNVLNAAQRQAFSRALREYSERAASGLTKAQLDEARQNAARAHPEHSERARAAIGCLRSLA